MGMDFRVLVWKRVCKITFFWSEIGSGSEEPGGTPPPRILWSNPPPLPRATTIFLSITSDQFNEQLTRGAELKNLLSEISISILAIWF